MRPAWVQLSVLMGVLVGLYAIMFGTGTLTPKLGIDLRGGTSVILTPKTTNGQKVTGGAIDKAVDIIRQRVNGFGVAEAEVKRAGNRIEITVPGRGRNDVVDLVGQTAELRFREVYQTAAATPTVTPTSPSASPGAAKSATPTPTPRASSSVGSAGSATPTTTPSATSTQRPAVPNKALAAATTPPAAAATTAPAAGATTPAATPSTTPSATPSPSASSSATDATTPPADVTARFAALTCGKTDVRQGAVSNDSPLQWTAACDRDGTAKYLLKPAKVVGTDVKSATATIQSAGGANAQISTGQWEVVLSFTGKGQGKFTKLTEQTVGRQVAIVLDGIVQSAPTINDRIPGDASITGNFSQKEAEDLANVLRYGALPLSFEKSQAESISPTLGRDSLHAGLLAGVLGMGLVVIYSFAYYRLLGFVTIASLLCSGLMVYACVVLLGSVIDFTLSLAGIAGLIVAVGVTADSFVVFYERLKDEVREGRTVRSSVERGWARARRTILSADTVSFLAAAVLYLLSIGSVKGFAFTLGLSTILDVVVVFLFTKPVVSLLLRKPLFSTSRFSGLTVRAVGGRQGPPGQPPARPRLSKRAPAGSGGGAHAGRGREV